MKFLLLSAILVLSGCMRFDGSQAPSVVQPASAQQIYKNVDRFVDKEMGIVCYINRSTYFRQSDSIACVELSQ